MAYTESGANINATWQTCDQIMVVADGQVSTLTLTDGAGSSSATFVGTISHTNPLTATTPLLCYVKDQNNPSAVTVNADGTYTYTSGAFLSQDGTMASAAKCNLYYGMAQYGDGSNISCDFSVNTSMMKFAVDASGLTEGEATLSYKSGGAITATGGEHGAGIGSGRDGSFNGIDISNGIQYVTATSGSDDAKPIGAGEGDTNNSPVKFGTVNVAEMTVKDGDKFEDYQGYLTIAVSTDADKRAVWTLTPWPDEQ